MDEVQNNFSFYYIDNEYLEAIKSYPAPSLSPPDLTYPGSRPPEPTSPGSRSLSRDSDLGSSTSPSSLRSISCE